MKTYISILLSCLFLMIISCVKMEDVHQKYIPDGETIYRVKPSNVVAYPGNNRVKLVWRLVCPTLVTKCEIRDKDSILAEIPVEYKDTVNMECTLSNLEEKTYTFSLYSLDAEGNSSVQSDVIVEIFGDKYSSSLKTTTSLKSVWRNVDNKQKILVNLSERVSAKISGTNVFYKSISGKEECVLVDNEVSVVEIQDVAEGSYFKLQDLYQPVADCIDMFPAPIKEYAVSELPMEGSRTFSVAYKVEENTVYGKLTSAFEGTLYTKIKYGDKEVVVNPDVNEVTLEGIMSADKISLETILQTEEGQPEYSAVIQTFNVKELLSKINMKSWEVINFSSQQSGEGDAAWAIDGQLGTFWHTQYSPEEPGYPHFITVDMKESAEVKAIAVARRNGNGNIAALFSLEISQDGVNWNPADEFSVDNAVDGLQIVQLGTPVSGRYFKLTGKRSATSAAYMCIGEINLFR